MLNIKLYTRPLCGWCQDAKRHLQEKNLAYNEVDVGRDSAAYAEMQRLSGQTYVPTIVVNGKVLADFDVAQLEQFLATITP
jgi:glutaredoxin 3